MNYQIRLSYVLHPSTGQVGLMIRLAMLICRQPKCTTWLHFVIKCKLSDLSHTGLVFILVKLWACMSFSKSNSMLDFPHGLEIKDFIRLVGGFYF